ncbi:hypothetical protein EPZ47_11580 [Pseudomonas viciae]|uniref:Uncharacterized protein n=1 Tax=Pseudomonas viciae TaxID=2505979 RepID=A0A4P7PFD1_9PSED|nr:DUF6678 family protein [Pseudomonas viciae]QBZ89319.1 hypothetical protein EPZ47_11580 [Pseudomonas viciae]
MRGTDFRQQLPEPDDAVKAKLHRLLAAGTILPVMNKTKWAELIEAMLGSPQMRPEFRLHSVLAPSGYCTDWDGDWHYHVHPVAEIEWIELRAVSLDWLLSTLRKHNLPFTIEGETPRVLGYTRLGLQPVWC